MAPSEQERRPHRVEIQMRFSDTDALGHLNNGSYAVYAETARLEFLRVLGETRPSMILAHLALDFRRQVRFGESVYVDTWVERIGTTSVALRHVVWAAGERAAEVRAVVVSFDYGAQRPRPWTDEQRALFEPFVVEASEESAAALQR
jgi:acyl-CoA thioester hydrolase